MWCGNWYRMGIRVYSEFALWSRLTSSLSNVYSSKSYKAAAISQIWSNSKHPLALDKSIIVASKLDWRPLTSLIGCFECSRFTADSHSKWNAGTESGFKTKGRTVVVTSDLPVTGFSQRLPPGIKQRSRVFVQSSVRCFGCFNVTCWTTQPSFYWAAVEFCKALQKRTAMFEVSCLFLSCFKIHGWHHLFYY